MYFVSDLNRQVKRVGEAVQVLVMIHTHKVPQTQAQTRIRSCI